MATFGRDTPMDRPNPGGRAAVFVPHPEAEEAVTDVLKNGSGMVGFLRLGGIMRDRGGMIHRVREAGLP